MAAAKLKATWSEDIYGKSILLVEKSRGKLNLDEVGEFLRRSEYGVFQGVYVAFINAQECTCEGSGWIYDIEEKKGDSLELYKAEPGEPCPVCAKTLPDFEYCPECGAPLQGREVMEVVKKELAAKVEETLEGMKREAVGMIQRTNIQETRKAWYHSHLGSIDFASQIGLITEERRQQLYKEFKECVRQQEPGEEQEREEK